MMDRDIWAYLFFILLIAGLLLFYKISGRMSIYDDKFMQRNRVMRLSIRLDEMREKGDPLTAEAEELYEKVKNSQAEVTNEDMKKFQLETTVFGKSKKI